MLLKGGRERKERVRQTVRTGTEREREGRMRERDRLDRVGVCIIMKKGRQTDTGWKTERQADRQADLDVEKERAGQPYRRSKHR